MRKIIITGAAAIAIAAGVIAIAPTGQPAEAHNSASACHHTMVHTPVHLIEDTDLVYFNGYWYEGTSHPNIGRHNGHAFCVAK